MRLCTKKSRAERPGIAHEKAEGRKGLFFTSHAGSQHQVGDQLGGVGQQLLDFGGEGKRGHGFSLNFAACFHGVGHKLLDDAHGFLVGEQGFEFIFDGLGAVGAQVGDDFVADGNSGKILKKTHSGKWLLREMIAEIFGGVKLICLAREEDVV